METLVAARTAPEMKPELYVVMPVYNESASLAKVVDEWLSALRSLSIPFVFDCLDDASSDNSLDLLRSLDGIRVSSQERNRGHGGTCLQGYARALEAQAEWIFQIDSDGQCDPSYLTRLWDRRAEGRAVYGYRWPREDGLTRFLMSRVVSLVTWLATGVWVADANSPYRLMHHSLLDETLPRVPADFHLANVAVAVLQASEIRWVQVGFRARQGGCPSQSTTGLLGRAWQMYRQLRGLR